MENLNNKVILIQGAMDIEVNSIIDSLKDKNFKKISDYEFYEGTINNTNIVVSKTLIGTINSTIATTLGILNFKPDIVINQGIAGAHKDYVHTGDIIIGKKCCNINAYDMPIARKGEGSNPFNWEPSNHSNNIIYTDSNLLNNVKKAIESNCKNKIYAGVLGSGDLFSRECDRITWISNTFNNLCEDMESIGTYSVCDKFNIPCIGIRIISNNELLLEKYDREKAIDLQKILINIFDII